MAGTGRAGPDPQTDGAMFLEETPEQLALRQELRAYYADLLTAEVRAGLGDVGEGGELWRQVVQRIGKDGWLGIGWPKEFGGQGRPATDQFIFFDETAATIRKPSSSRPSWRARSTSPSVTPSPKQAPTWRRCAPGRCATGTSTS